MSIEYSTVKGAMIGIAIADIAQALISWSDYQMLEVTDDELLLRFTRIPLRTSWPEDAMVRIHGGRCYVAIHGGNVSERELLITRLESLLTQRSGKMIELEEL